MNTINLCWFEWDESSVGCCFEIIIVFFKWNEYDEYLFCLF